MFRSPATTDEVEIDAQRAALDAKQAQLRSHKQSVVSLTKAVNVAEQLLTTWDERVQGASQRIAELQQTILTLAARTFDGVVTSGNEPYAQILTAYASITTLTLMLTDAGRVRDHLSERLADARLALSIAQRNAP